VFFINSYFVIVRLDRTIQNLLKRLDSPIMSGNDDPFSCHFIKPLNRTTGDARISCLSKNTYREKRMKNWIIPLVMICVISGPAAAGQKKPVKPAQKDKCPVCGMFVYKYPDFVAEIIFQDGSYAVFDGVKDMFKYYFNLKKYNQKKTLDNIDSLYVTDYYDLSLIDARRAFYVRGSDVYGPMGKELIPFVNHPDAQEFMRDHRGSAILKFQDITPKTIKGLD